MSSSSGRLRPEDLRFDPPAVPGARVEMLARERYGITGSFAPLRGERDHNTLITGDDGSQFVLKIASPSEEVAGAEFQCGALRHVADVDPALGVPRVVTTLDGDAVTTVDVAGEPAAVRMLTYLSGITFDEAGHLPARSLRAVGEFQGRLALALAGYHHPAAGNFMAWDLDSGLVSNDDLWAELSGGTATVTTPCRARVERATASLGGLRRQVVHNDGHRGNLLRRDASSTEVIGAIDFGDLVETALVADLAICASGFLVGQHDLPAALAALAYGYHASIPLLAEEIALLADLALARMVLSALLVEYQVRHTPHIAAAVAAELPDQLATIAAWQQVDGAAIAARIGTELDRSNRT